MNAVEIKECMSLMGFLWTSYRPPQTDEEIAAQTGIWMQFFSRVSQEEVTRTIMELSAEGGEYAPQVGQIYARIKAGRAPRLAPASNPYFQLALSAAAICELPPPESADVQVVRSWFQEVFYPARPDRENGGT